MTAGGTSAQPLTPTIPAGGTSAQPLKVATHTTHTLSVVPQRLIVALNNTAISLVKTSALIKCY